MVLAMCAARDQQGRQVGLVLSQQPDCSPSQQLVVLAVRVMARDLVGAPRPVGHTPAPQVARRHLVLAVVPTTKVVVEEVALDPTDSMAQTLAASVGAVGMEVPDSRAASPELNLFTAAEAAAVAPREVVRRSLALLEAAALVAVEAEQSSAQSPRSRVARTAVVAVEGDLGGQTPQGNLLKTEVPEGQV